MTYLWLLGSPITMIGNPNTPEQFIWFRRTHTIQEISDRWRWEFEWWYIPVARDYFQVMTTTRLFIVLYHDLLSNEWYVQRLYD